MEREQCRVRPRTLRLEDCVDQVHTFLPAGSVVSLLPEKPGEGKEKNNLGVHLSYRALRSLRAPLSMTLFLVGLSIFVDPHPDPGQKGKCWPGKKEGGGEVGGVADALGHPAGERTHKRAGQTSQRAEQRILGGSLGLVAHTHEKGEERRCAE